MRLDLFVKLKYQSYTKILSVGIKYSVCVPTFYVINYRVAQNTGTLLCTP